MRKTKIILVDDHTLFRNGLKLLLNNHTNLEIVAEASNGKEFILLLGHIDADIALMDIDMPVMNGIEATKACMEIKPGLKIIALSMFGEEEYYYKMIDAGVKGFLLKNSEITEVIKAINTVMNGESYFSQELLVKVIKNIKTVHETESSAADLSGRELEVLEQICKGLSNQEIADVLFISKRTVDKHRANLLEKTNSKNTANLIMYAIKYKLIKV